MPLTRWILKDNPLATRLTVEGVWEWTFKREYFRTKFAELWNSTATTEQGRVIPDPDDTIDVILCPAAPGAAPALDHSKYWGYTSIWNLVNWPGLVFPVSLAFPNELDALLTYIAGFCGRSGEGSQRG